jgi:phosphomannomutase
VLNLSAFKAYDVRGKIPEEINEDLVYQIGRAFAAFVKPKKVAVGRDIRLTSDVFAKELIRGLTDAGVDVLDIGLCGTEGVYFATFAWKLDGGIMVTASHNPPDYNGLKLVREQSKPIGSDSGLKDIAAMIASGKLPPPAAVKGKVEMLDTSARYIEHLLGYVNRSALRKLKVVVDAGNGGAGLAVDKLEPHLPFEFIKVRHEPNGKFPQGVPNPMLEENRGPTLEALRKSGADVGIAWDGDYDRCFFYDSKGVFIEGYYIVGLLAEAFLVKQPGARIVYDPRLTWNTIDTVKRLGGVPVMSKSGHAFIKQKMREVDGAYGGEMSAHHYFRDFSYCDSGMIRGCWFWSACASRASRSTNWSRHASRHFPRAARSIASCPMRRRCWSRPRRSSARAPSLITPTGCPSITPTGASMCAPPIPNHWSGSTSSHAATKR